MNSRVPLGSTSTWPFRMNCVQVLGTSTRIDAKVICPSPVFRPISTGRPAALDDFIQTLAAYGVQACTGKPYS